MSSKESLPFRTELGRNGDNAGRYCLNDLHKAAGGAPKHQPAFFARRDETKELIDELSSADSQTLNPLETIVGKGKQQGTYVVKELVYAYAMLHGKTEQAALLVQL